MKKAKIDDAGEVIPGARKWKHSGMTPEDVAGMNAEEILLHAGKDAVWPKPDWKQAVEEGMDPVAAACVKIVRDRLAATPKARAGIDPVDQRKAYVWMASSLRDMFMSCRTLEDVKAVYARAADGVDFRRGSEAAVRFFSVYSGRKCPFSVDYRDVAKARKAVDDGFPEPVPAWRRGVEARQAHAGGWRLYRGRAALGEGAFPTAEDAWAWLKENPEVGRRVKRKEGPALPPDRPHLDRIERDGLADWRSGRSVSPEEFIETFGFRGVQFGDWVPQDERQRLLDMGYDAMMDLASVMGWEPAAMSLGGALSVSFGARGQGGRRAAHYEPGQRVFNMTRMSGAGAVAHEFAHALDHWAGSGGTRMPDVPSGTGWTSWLVDPAASLSHRGEGVGGAWERVRDAIISAPLTRDRMAERLSVLVADSRGKIERTEANVASVTERTQTRATRKWLAEASAWIEGEKGRLAGLEEKLAAALAAGPDAVFGETGSRYLSQAHGMSSSTDYWKRPCELFARAFESWVQDEVEKDGGRSQYLVYGTEEDRYADGAVWKGNPYPCGDERERIGGAMRELASVMAPEARREAGLDDGSALRR